MSRTRATRDRGLLLFLCNARSMAETAKRVADRYYQEKYARLVRAMSVPEAKKVLGFPPTAEPTPEEVAKAYKAKVFENHPDRGGDLDKMVAVNVAKDVLDGKHKQRFRLDPTPGGGGEAPSRPERPKREPPKTVDTMKGQTFESATASLPKADWKFISKPEWAEHPRDEKGSQRGYSSDVWAIFGETETEFVIAGIKNRKPNLIFDHDKGGNVVIESDWQITHVAFPKSKDLVKLGPAAVKKVTSEFADGAKPKRPPMKYVTWPGGPLEERSVRAIRMGSGGANLKDILLSTGMISGEHTAIQGRKTNVEVIPHSSHDKYKRLRAERGKGAPVYTYEAFDYEVRVNGKSEKLTDETAENLVKNHFIIGVFSHDPHDNVPKNITKLRPRPHGMTLGPKDAITLLYQALTSEPAWLHDALKKAASEYAEEVKTAAREAVRAAMAS